MLLSGSIESDNHNGLLKNVRCVRIGTKKKIALVWFHAVKW